MCGGEESAIVTVSVEMFSHNKINCTAALGKSRVCMFTRPDFDGACKAFIAKYSSSEAVRSPATDGLDGWAWDEHTVRKPRSLVIASRF